MKICNKCGVEKSLSDFSVHSKVAGGKKYVRNSCKDCLRPRGPHYTRKHKYGLSEDQFRAMLEAQGGVCAICETSDSGSRDWCVDHDHACCPGQKSCGKCVRALLCQNCNKGLGNFKDNPDALMAAAAYLLQRLDLLSGQATASVRTQRQGAI